MEYSIAFILDKLSENAISETIPSCVHRNFYITGLDVIAPSSLPTVGLTECQKLCQLTVGCVYFSWRNGYVVQCFLKLSMASKPWQEITSFPRPNYYSGPANCGMKFTSSLYI